MYRFLLSCYRVLDRAVAALLPDSTTHRFRAFSLRLARRLYPERIVAKSVGELVAMSYVNSWSPPTLPVWVREELAELSEIDPDVHPDGAWVTSAEFYSAPWTYDMPGKAYFALRAKLPPSVDVMLFAPWIKRGGADLGLIHFANALHRDFGQKVVIVTTEAADSPWRDRLVDGVVFVDAGHVLSELHLHHQVDVVVRLLLQVAPRTLHIMNSLVAWEAVKRNGLAIRQSTRIYASLYCDDVTEAGQRVGYARKYLRWCHHALDGVISDNSRTPLEWVESIGVCPSLFTVVPFPAPTANGRPTEPLRDDACNRILWAGRLDRQKRPDILAAVVRAMPNYQFDIHGSALIDTGLAHELDALPNATLHGSYERFSDIARDSHLAYLYTSQWDGLPNVLLEAASCGIPIVASAVGGVPDLLHSDQIVEDVEDVDGYVSRLHALAGSTDLRAAWRDRQADALREHHSIASFLDGIRTVPGYLWEISRTAGKAPHMSPIIGGDLVGHVHATS